MDSGRSVLDVCRQYGVAEATVYRWRTRYGGMDIAEVRRLKQLEEENRRLKSIVAEQVMDIQLLKEINSKKW